MSEFSTVEVADIIGVSRLNFYEWTCRDYIRPIRASKRRGNAAVFDMDGLVAAGIFARLRKNIRRPAAGKISQWCQEHGSAVPGDMLYCAIKDTSIIMYYAYNTHEMWISSDYVIAIPIGSIRKEIETKIKEIHSNGYQQADPGGNRGQASQDI